MPGVYECEMGAAMTEDIISSHWAILDQEFGELLNDSLKTRVTRFPELLYAHHLLSAYKCNHVIEHAGKKVLKMQNRLLGFDSAKQMLSLSKIQKYSRIYGQFYTICVIGDGYGFFASLIKETIASVRVISVNIEKIQKIDKQYATNKDILYLDAREYEKLKGQNINLFVNIASMQEMNPPIIAKYFEYMRMSSAKEVYFYCCNQLEKILPDGTVVDFSEYPWDECEILLDEACPWYQGYVDHNHPFYHPFDGVIWHRLVRLKKQEREQG